MTYKDIDRVNKEIKTTDIKGTAYSEVSQRITAFRKLYPDGFIRTSIEELKDGICVMRAFVGCYEVGESSERREVLLATGTAYEKEGSSFINKTSYIENCETSAVGRALGMLGIGIDNSIASFDEAQNAHIQQEAEEKVTPVMIKAIKKAIENNGLKEDKILEYFKLQRLEDMNVMQMRQFNDMVEKSKKEDKKESK